MPANDNKTFKKDHRFWRVYSKHTAPDLSKLFIYGLALSLIVFYIAHVLIFLNSKHVIDSYARDILFQTEQLEFQIDRGLQRAVSKSPATKCTDADLKHYRAILSEYYYLDDLGKLNGNQVICSVKLGVLDKPILLEGTPVQSTHGIAFWNNQDKLFVDIDEQPVFAKGNAIASLSKSFLAQVHIDFATKNGTGGYLFLKDKAYILKIFDKLIDLDQVRQTIEQDSTRFNWLLSPKTIINTKYCNAHAEICLMTLVSQVGIFGTSYFYTMLVALASILIGLLMAYWIIRRSQSRTFTKRLRQAIDAGEIYPVYQPKIKLDTNTVTGVETLARWNDALFGFVSPDIFISVAEQASLIKPLTEQFIKRTFQDLHQTLESNPDFTVSINIATSLMVDDVFINSLIKETAQYQFDNKQVILEITERSTSNSQEMTQSSKRIKKQGYQVSLDDFGTGFSNLAWLTTFEPDEIKIDKMFTQSIGAKDINNITLEGIFSMIEHLNVDVVFEGVETENELIYIKQRVPHAVAQGWYFAKPKPIDELLAFLESHLPK